MDTPSWLQNSTSAPSPAPDTLAAAPAPAVAPVNIGDDEQTEPDLPGVILTMRLANMGVAAAMIIISVRFNCCNYLMAIHIALMDLFFHKGIWFNWISRCFGKSFASFLLCFLFDHYPTTIFFCRRLCFQFMPLSDLR